MFIAMNRFKVIKEERKAFEDLWVTRQSHLDEVKGFRAFHLLRGPEREDMCSIHLIQYGRRKRILRRGPSPNNSAPPINTLASASRSHSATRNSKGSKSSRRSKLRIHPHSGCSTLGLLTGELYGAGLTDAGTPCACFRDHEVSADTPKSHCGNPLLIKELRRPKLTGCDWQFFPRRNGVVGVPARVRAEKPTPSMGRWFLRDRKLLSRCPDP